MKTKHRTPWQWTNESALHKGELRATITEQTTRWKRKNRVKQLKSTIARLKAENAYLRHEIELIADCLQLKGDKR